jgi:hypothetical protein
LLYINTSELEHLGKRTAGYGFVVRHPCSQRAEHEVPRADLDVLVAEQFTAHPLVLRLVVVGATDDYPAFGSVVDSRQEE